MCSKAKADGDRRQKSRRAQARFCLSAPGAEHAISNSGLVDLVFLVVTSPVTDDEKVV
jgi:hypothetical protein